MRDANTPPPTTKNGEIYRRRFQSEESTFGGFWLWFLLGSGWLAFAWPCWLRRSRARESKSARFAFT
ncbi:hypothetical protein [Thiocapsa marina]|uniref:hypothetical protein n=1 Tax=Thiocapsa marina TaxID=244573 RepID=UPI000593A245|nr:hypothetical protein [Thiocapsa marina]